MIDQDEGQRLRRFAERAWNGWQRIKRAHWESYGSPGSWRAHLPGLIIVAIVTVVGLLMGI